MSKQTTERKTARPVHEIRLGLIKAAIWANATREGVMRNVTFERSFKDGDEWRTTHSFGRDDLLKVAKLADEAHSWITRQPPPSGSGAPLNRANAVTKPSTGGSGCSGN